MADEKEVPLEHRFKILYETVSGNKVEFLQESVSEEHKELRLLEDIQDDLYHLISIIKMINSDVAISALEAIGHQLRELIKLKEDDGKHSP